ncbi:YbaB/EbfC family nucleoid-associated protein [Actinoplanes sp. NPDC049548]|uniref:YbaB/EbfC family nucleoid-associated protein n=1 Tax=Actinoplanes sp. NPDC049548 TaxID=3155152 RepID=UPI003413E319
MDLSGGASPLLEPGEAVERMAAWKDRIDRLATDTKAMSDRLGELRVTAADDNRMVEVTVDAQGALVDIHLGRRIQQVEPDVVARTIMATIRAARLRTADRAQEIIAETVGTDSPAARAIAAQVGDRLRDTAPGDRPEWS